MAKARSDAPLSLYLCGSCGCGEAYHNRKGRCRVPGCDCLGWSPVLDSQEGPWEALESTNYGLPMATYQEDPRIAPEGSGGPSWLSIPPAPKNGELDWTVGEKWSPAQRAFVAHLKGRIKEMWSQRIHAIVANERGKAKQKARRAVEREQDRILTLLLASGMLEAARVVAQSCPGVEVVSQSEEAVIDINQAA